MTGASGFIGSRLIEILAAEAGFVVTAIIRDSTKINQLATIGVHTIVTDMANRAGIGKAVEGQHTVINLAHDFKRSQKHNLRCFTNLYEACTRHGIQHLVHVSSIVVYDDWPLGNVSEESSFGQPGTEYKNTKVAIENAIQSGSEKGLLQSSVLQPTIVYGPYSWMWTDSVVEKLLSGTVVLPAGQEGICNAVYVDDVADALVLAASHPGCSGEKYIISGSTPPTWPEFFESYNQFLGMNSIQYIDVDVLAGPHLGSANKMKNILANPMQLAHWKPVRDVLNLLRRVLGDWAIDGLKTSVQSLKKSTGPIIYYPGAGDLELYCSKGECSIEKAKQKLGYIPKIDFNAGFKLTTEYIDGKLRD